MRTLSDYNEYLCIVEKYNKKGCFSNDYIQKEAEKLILVNKLYVEEYTDNLFLFVDIFIIYYSSNGNSFLSISAFSSPAAIIGALGAK